jgi:site-specific recombinase XerC
MLLRTSKVTKAQSRQSNSIMSAIRMLYDFLVIRQLVPANPTASVRGPKYVVKRGKTPVWEQ